MEGHLGENVLLGSMLDLFNGPEGARSSTNEKPESAGAFGFVPSHEQTTTTTRVPLIGFPAGSVPLKASSHLSQPRAVSSSSSLSMAKPMKVLQNYVSVPNRVTRPSLILPATRRTDGSRGALSP